MWSSKIELELTNTDFKIQPNKADHSLLFLDFATPFTACMFATNRQTSMGSVLKGSFANVIKRNIKTDLDRLLTHFCLAALQITCNVIWPAYMELISTVVKYWQWFCQLALTNMNSAMKIMKLNTLLKYSWFQKNNFYIAIFLVWFFKIIMTKKGFHTQ